MIELKISSDDYKLIMRCISTAIANEEHELYQSALLDDDLSAKDSREEIERLYALKTQLHIHVLKPTGLNK